MPGFRVTALVRFLANNVAHFLIACLYQKGGTLAIFMCSWMDSENIHALLDNFWAVFGASIHALVGALSTQRL